MKKEVQKRVEEHLTDFKKKYPKTEYVGIFLQGSQNYKLDYEDSDVDTKMILLPSFEDFIRVNKPMSHTYVRENNEHIDLKDIRLVVDIFKKQNVNFVEILFSEYLILNDRFKEIFQPMIDNRERIARFNPYGALNCMVGMSLEKYKALEHPYPSILHKIEKFGYDPKQLHHIFRMRDFIERYVKGESYKECLVPKDTEFMIAVKKGLYTVEEARVLAKELVMEIGEIRQKYQEKHPNVIDEEVGRIMADVVLNIIRQYFTEELIKGGSV